MNDQVNYAKIQRIQDDLEALTIGTFGTGFVTDAMLYESGIKSTVAQHTSQLAEKANKGSGATIIIAASNTSNNSKATANFICTGTNDETIINQAINSLPTASFKCPTGTFTAPYGKIIFTEGKYNIATKISIPKGSRIILQGMGRAYQDIDFGGTGGTLLAGTDVNGVIYVPYNTQFGDSSTLIIRDMDIRQDAVQGHSVGAVDLTGVMSGGLENVGIINDKAISGVACQDGFGLNANMGSYGNTFWISHVDVGSFGANGRFCAVIGANHCVIEDLHLNGGAGAANALQIPTAGDRFEIGNLHLFQFGNASNSTNLIKLIEISAVSANKLESSVLIRNLSFESIIPRTGQTTSFLNFVDTKSRLVIGRINDNNTSNLFNIMNGVQNRVVLRDYCGNNLYPNNAGFSITTPALPTTMDTTSTGKTQNTNPFPVAIYLTATGTNAHVIDGYNNDRAIGSVTNIVLPPKASIWFESALPTSWYWYGL